MLADHSFAVPHLLFELVDVLEGRQSVGTEAVPEAIVLPFDPYPFGQVLEAIRKGLHRANFPRSRWLKPLQVGP